MNLEWERIERNHFKVIPWEVYKGGKSIRIVERVREKTYDLSLCKKAADWLSNIMCELSLIEELDVEAARFHDDKISLAVALKRNKMGCYVEAALFSKLGHFRPRRIYLPAGVKRNGWVIMGEKIAFACRDYHPINNTVNLCSNQEWPKLGRGGNHTFDVSGGITIKNFGWWNNIVRVNQYCSEGEWSDLITTLSNRADVWKSWRKDDGSSFLATTSADEALKFESLNSICFGEKMISLTRWKLTINTFEEENVCDKTWWISLMGFHLHLKLENEIRKICSRWGTILQIDGGSMAMEATTIRLQMKLKSLNDLPRCCFLTEKEYVYTIKVATVGDANAAGIEGTQPEKTTAVDLLENSNANRRMETPLNEMKSCLNPSDMVNLVDGEPASEIGEAINGNKALEERGAFIEDRQRVRTDVLELALQIQGTWKLGEPCCRTRV